MNLRKSIDQRAQVLRLAIGIGVITVLVLAAATISLIASVRNKTQSPVDENPSNTVFDDESGDGLGLTIFDCNGNVIAEYYRESAGMTVDGEINENRNAPNVDTNSVGDFPYPYFTDYVQSLLVMNFDHDTVFQGGLKVYTTIDPTYQEAAERAVATRLSEIGNERLDAALVAVDPDTGYIKAMVGGRDYQESQFNLATQARRQPGSSFKLFTLVAALRQGMSPDVYINCDSPIILSPTWTVHNFGDVSYGNITMADAFSRDYNTGFAQVSDAIGTDKVIEVAHDMGIWVDLPPYPSTVSGTVGVPPVQMAEAYSTIATGGLHRDAIAITRIEDRNGNTVYEHEDNPVRVVDESIASAALEVMKGVTTWGGTAEVVGSGMTVDQPVAGKTGTTENYRDLWFCGITPQLSVSIWCGYREEAEVYVWGSYGQPSNTACPIFTYFVNSVLDGVPREEFPTSSAQPTYKDNSTWTFKSGQPDEQQYYDYDTNHEDDQTDTTNTD